jgi:hypothetical protein
MAMTRGRADAILAAVQAVIERRRAEIDRDPTLRRVEFVVKLRERGSRPFAVVYRAEMADENEPC